MPLHAPCFFPSRQTRGSFVSQCVAVSESVTYNPGIWGCGRPPHAELIATRVGARADRGRRRPEWRAEQEPVEPIAIPTCLQCFAPWPLSCKRARHERASGRSQCWTCRWSSEREMERGRSKGRRSDDVPIDRSSCRCRVRRLRNYLSDWVCSSVLLLGAVEGRHCDYFDRTPHHMYCSSAQQRFGCRWS